jgi:hypothetical protein
MKTSRFFQRYGILCLLLSQIGFGQWTPVGGPTKDVMYLAANGTDIFAQTNTGVFYSTDSGLHWTQANSGLADSLVSAFPADSANFLLTNILNQLYFLPGGLNIEKLRIEYSSLVALLTSMSILYPVSSFDSIFVSLDTGSTALRLSEIMSSLALYAAGLDTADILSKIEIAKLLLSMNGGAEWISVQKIMSSISVRAGAKIDNYAFAGTNRGVFRAGSSGTDWSQVNFGLADTNVHALVTINKMLFAGTDGGVFLTTNNGTAWKAVNTGLTNKKVAALAVSGNYLFAATQGGGIFLSMNYGTSWKAVNQGLTYLIVNALAVSNSTLFAGTSGGGLWKRPVSQMITDVSDGRDAVPERFSLSQNYPNPFNPSTTLQYGIPMTSRVRLQICNLLGQVVAELVDGEQAAGLYRVQWNANVSSGIYFYRIDAVSTIDPNNRFVQVKKMSLLK